MHRLGRVQNFVGNPPEYLDSGAPGCPIKEPGLFIFHMDISPRARHVDERRVIP